MTAIEEPKVRNKDRLRTILKRVLNRRIYRMGSNLLNTLQVIRLHGLSTYKVLYRPPKTNTEHYQSVNFRKYLYPIYFRPGTPDVITLVQNIVREEYGFIPSHIKPNFIIDGGSFIGDVAIYFLNQFKKCRVVALEPNKDNYTLAKLNLRNYKERTELINKGLWSCETKLKIAGESVYSQIVDTENDGNEIECIDIKTLIKNFGIDRIDILKLDVEGAEKEILLKNSSEWLRATRIIIVEFHGKEIKEQCTGLLQENGFEGYQYRSLYYFFNKNSD